MQQEKVLLVSQKMKDKKEGKGNVYYFALLLKNKVTISI